MSFSALVNLGVVGEDISGYTVSISGCTGNTCQSGCSSLTTGQSVNSFPKSIDNIPDGVNSLYINVDDGPCAGTNQCIDLTFIYITPTPTPTNTPTLTPTNTPTLTPTPTNTPTLTPTNTPTLTLTPTATPAPTQTPAPTSTPVSTFYLSSGVLDNNGHCGQDYLTGTPVYVAGDIEEVSPLLNKTLYSDPSLTNEFNGGALYYFVDKNSGASTTDLLTNLSQYPVISITSNGYVGTVETTNCSGGGGPL
jgi:hypothetical protein